MSLRKNLIQHLSLIADLMEFKGENRFKVNAFRNGANIIRRLNSDIESLIRDKSIGDLKGIGKGLQTVIYEFYQSGNSVELQKLLEDIPPGIIDLMNVKGLGASKIRTLYSELNIKNIADLENACSNNQVAELKGFGLKTQEKILKEIERIKNNKGFVLLSEAIYIAGEIEEDLKKIKHIKQISITGELRRKREIISKIEFLLQITNYEKFLEDLSNLFEYNVLEENSLSYTLSLLVNYEPKVIIYLVENSKLFPKKLFASTGSEGFIKQLTKAKNIPDGENEESIFANLDLTFVIPEMRETEWFDAPGNLRTNSDLVFNDFKGLLHFHTTWSDGINTLAEMFDAATELGFKFAAVCDHSKTAFYANGLKEKDVLKQKEEINELSKNSKIKLYQGIESDILRNGDLDYNDDFLHNFDFIVASVHSQFNLSEEEMTKRIIKAIENPYTNVIGHPTGRLLLRRDPYAVNMKKVIDACSRNKVAIEINANPHRLDLDWRLIYYAREQGCKFAINPDAHSTAGINDIKYGIMIARKGGIQKSEVINTFDLNKFERFIEKK